MYSIERSSNGWTIKDCQGNYLNYIENHKVANTCYGVIDGKEIVQGNFKTNWKKSGSGKLSVDTLDKIEAMDKYFFKNYKI